MVKFTDIDKGFIDYRLNILGIRVWADACQLIAKKGRDWQVIGPAQPLPVRVPNAAKIMETWVDELRMTAYQFQLEYPDSDLAAVLGKTKIFREALENGRRG